MMAHFLSTYSNNSVFIMNNNLFNLSINYYLKYYTITINNRFLTEIENIFSEN